MGRHFSRGDPPKRLRPGGEPRALVSLAGDGAMIPQADPECKGGCGLLGPILVRCIRATTPAEVAEAADAVTAWTTPQERGTLLIAAARAAEPEDLAALAEAVVDSNLTGAPVPAFDTIRNEARDWATFASDPERRAFLAAIWGRLSARDRAGFLNAVKARAGR